MNTVQSLIDHRASECANKTFLTSAETGEKFNYAELQAYSRQVMCLLDSHAVASGDTVGFLMDNGYWTTALFLGIMYSGRVVLPLNAVAGPDQIEYVLSHSDVKMVFVSPFYEEKFGEVINAFRSSITFVRCTENDGPDKDQCPDFGAVDEPGRKPLINDEDTALMIYTSGTTGRPKGVLLSHKNVIAGGRNTMIAHDLVEDDVSLCVLPLYHINAEMVSVMAPLVSNGEVVMSRRLSIKNFWYWIIQHQCTWFSGVPTIISYLIEQRQRDQEEGNVDQPDFVGYGIGCQYSMGLCGVV